MLRHRLEAWARETSQLAAHLRWLEPIALRGLAACAETIIPPNDLGAPDISTTKVVDRARHWWRILPPESRGLMLLLYSAMELGGPFLGRRFGRLSKLPIADRLALFQSWRESEVPFFNFIADGVKSPVVMMYLSHPDALRWLGVTTCEHPVKARASLPARARLATTEPS